MSGEKFGTHALVVDALGRPLRVELAQGITIATPQGNLLEVRSRRGRALLAMIAVAGPRGLSRRQLAATLWRKMDHATASRRFRVLLHDTKKVLDDAVPGALILTGEHIALSRNVRVVQPEGEKQEGSIEAWAGFLCELENIDPGIDHWLTEVRSDRSRQRNATTEQPSSNSSDLNRVSVDDRPMIVVTKFMHVGFATQETHDELLTEEVATALARFRWYRLVTRNQRGEQFALGEQDLGKFGDYAIYGTYRHGAEADQLLVKVTNLQAMGMLVWSSEFQIARDPTATQWTWLLHSVAAQVDAEMLLIEADKVRRRPWADVGSVHSVIFSAMPAMFRMERKGFDEAGRLFEEITRANPDSSIAHIALAHWHVFNFGQGWTENPALTSDAARWAADRAISLDPNDARALTIAGHVRAYLHRKPEEGAALHRLALELNPASSLAWYYSGMSHAYVGLLADAANDIKHSVALAPNDPLAFYGGSGAAMVSLFEGRLEQVVVEATIVIERKPSFTATYKPLLSALGHLGRKEQSKTMLRQLMQIEPQFSLKRYRETTPFQRPKDVDYLFAGLVRAGAK